MRVVEVIAMIFCGICTLIDAVMCLLFISVAPSWERVKKRELEELRIQNYELKKFVRELLESKEDY